MSTSAKKEVQTAATVVPEDAVAKDSSAVRALKLLIGAGGIYAAFMYYGTLQEDVFRFKSADGSKFKEAWFLQSIEAFANVIVGLAGVLLSGRTRNLPLSAFALSGAAQVSAKAFTSLSLASGLSFPVVTLAKSAKMVPVMVGSLILGGASYTLREYLSVAAIIAGTCLVSMGDKKKADRDSSMLGLVFVCASLACDGITGGMQNRLKKISKDHGIKPTPWDFMFWTNFFMALIALVVSLGFGELTRGTNFCLQNREFMQKVLLFAACSAIGQSFIFFTIAEFDALVCTTVTTTRKIFSVLLSIFLKGHAISPTGWGGIGIASMGILSELFDHKKKDSHTKKT